MNSGLGQKNIPLTVLAYEGPQVRAYLSRLRLAGLRPQRIVLMVLKNHPATKKAVGTWLPPFLRIKYAQKVQDIANNYWPRDIKKHHPSLVNAIAGQVCQFCEHTPQIIEDIVGDFFYEDYTDDMTRVLVKGYTDPVLTEALSEVGDTALLYTGGGILRSNLLDLNNIKFIHIHPGYLPFVRGADGILWSTLVRSKLGLSAFYMNEGIDEGELIAAQEYDKMSFQINDQSRPDDKTLYRAIFSFFDPILRAEFLVRKVLSKGDNYRSLPSTPQDHSKAKIYRFMDQESLHKTLAILFP